MEEERRVDEDQSGLGAGSADSREIRWLVIRSRLLDGEEFVLVFDTNDVEEAEMLNPGKVIYILEEIEELYRHPRGAENLKRIHLIKKKFDGLIVPAKSPLGQRLIWDGLWDW